MKINTIDSVFSSGDLIDEGPVKNLRGLPGRLSPSYGKAPTEHDTIFSHGVKFRK